MLRVPVAYAMRDGVIRIDTPSLSLETLYSDPMTYVFIIVKTASKSIVPMYEAIFL